MTQEAQKHNVRVRTFSWTRQIMPDGRPKTGWLPVGAPSNFYPGPGYMVAHDTVEHAGNGSDWKHEMVAFGATMYDRAGNDCNMMETISHDFLGFTNENAWEIPEPPTTALWCKPLPDGGEKQLEHMFSHIEQEYRRAVAMHHILGNSPIGGGTTQQQLKVVLERAKVWFRIGWLIQRRLFNKRDGEQLFETYRNITNAVDESFYRQKPNLGDKLTVRLDRTANTFSIHRSAGV